MKQTALYILIFIVILFQSCNIFISSTSSYINNDSTAIFSTHPSRPFKYGFPFSKEEIRLRFSSYILDYNFNKGDIIADVGASSGWLEGAISVLTDSLTFYIQDIDTNLLNKDQFEKVITYFTKIKDGPQTCKFNYVIGNETETNLPDNYFDKIIINNSFHEFIFQSEMLDDIIKKIKLNGQIIISERFSNQYKTIRHPGCDLKAKKVQDIEVLFNSKGFFLTKMASPTNSFNNFLTFEKNKIKSEEYKKQIINIKSYLIELEKLNNCKISNDSNLTEEIAYFLKNHLNEINPIFRSLEAYLSFLGDDYFKQNKFDCAVNVYNVNQILYPESFPSYFQLGLVNLYLKNYDLALSYFRKCNEMEPNFQRTNEEIIKIELHKKMK